MMEARTKLQSVVVLVVLVVLVSVVLVVSVVSVVDCASPVKGAVAFGKKSIDDFSTVMEILDPFIQKMLFPILPFTSKLDSRQTD